MNDESKSAVDHFKDATYYLNDKERLDIAIKHYEKAIQMGKKDEYVHYWLGWCYNLYQDFENAELNL